MGSERRPGHARAVGLGGRGGRGPLAQGSARHSAATRRSRSSPAARWRTRPRSSRRGTTCWRRPGTTSRCDGLAGAPADPRRRGREAARHGRPRAPLHRPRHRCIREVPADDQGRIVVDGLRGVLAESEAPTIVIAPARRGEHGRLRRPRGDRGRDDRGRRVAPRRRRLRPVGGGVALAAAARRGLGARRLLGDRRTQVAERSLRHRRRVLRASRVAPRRARDPLRLPRALRPRGRARPARLDAGALAPRARLRDVRGAALARPRGRGRARRADVRACARARRRRWPSCPAARS